MSPPTGNQAAALWRKRWWTSTGKRQQRPWTATARLHFRRAGGHSLSMSNAESPLSPASRPVRAGDHVFLIDGSGYIFRAYHALPPLTRKSDGVPVGAVSGFCNMLWRLLKETEQTAVGVRPTHLAVIFF